MKNLIPIISLCFISLFITSCEKIIGEGPVVSEIRNHKNFSGLRVSVCGKINFLVAPTYSVELQAQENILDEIITKVSDDELVIKWDRPLKLIDCDDVLINISGPHLRSIYQSGSADLDIKGLVSERDLEIYLSGSGDINLEEVVLSDKLNSFLSGSGNIVIDNGKVQETELGVSGSGIQELSKFRTESCDASVSGSGIIKTNVEKLLDAHISGSGDIYYKGNPEIKSNISGSGKVRKL